MNVAVTEQFSNDFACSGNLFLPVPDTNLKEFLSDVLEMSRRHPEILDSIRKDQDTLGIKKKELRLKDASYFESKNEELPEILNKVKQRKAPPLHLQVGRPRMEAEFVLVFLVLRALAVSFLGLGCVLNHFSKAFSLPANCFCCVFHCLTSVWWFA